MRLYNTGMAKKVIKTYTMTDVICEELERQSSKYGLTASEYIRLLIVFGRDNADSLQYDAVGNRIELVGASTAKDVLSPIPNP